MKDDKEYEQFIIDSFDVQESIATDDLLDEFKEAVGEHIKNRNDWKYELVETICIFDKEGQGKHISLDEATKGDLNKLTKKELIRIIYNNLINTERKKELTEYTNKVMKNLEECEWINVPIDD